MKKALAILAVIAFVAALSSAATFQPTMDTFLRYNDGLPSNQQTNPAYYGQQSWTYGGQNEQRAGKPWGQDRFVMAFDKAAILADASAQLGHPATAADFTSGAVVMTLQLMASGSTFNHTAAYYPSYLTSTSAWVGEYSASFNYADGSDGTNPATINARWNNGVNDSALGQTPANGGAATYTVKDCPLYYDASVAPQVWAAADKMYQTFTYPGTTAAGYLFNTGNAYLEMCNDGSQDNVGFCFSKEGTVTLFGSTFYAGPVLSVVPEPCSMLLIAAGAVAMIRRRK